MTHPPFISVHVIVLILLKSDRLHLTITDRLSYNHFSLPSPRQQDWGFVFRWLLCTDCEVQHHFMVTNGFMTQGDKQPTLNQRSAEITPNTLLDIEGGYRLL